MNIDKYLLVPFRIVKNFNTYYSISFGTLALVISVFATYIHYRLLGFGITDLSPNFADLVTALLQSSGYLFATFIIFLVYSRFKFNAHYKDLDLKDELEHKQRKSESSLTDTQQAILTEVEDIDPDLFKNNREQILNTLTKHQSDLSDQEYQVRELFDGKREIETELSTNLAEIKSNLEQSTADLTSIDTSVSDLETQIDKEREKNEPDPQFIKDLESQVSSLRNQKLKLSTKLEQLTSESVDTQRNLNVVRLEMESIRFEKESIDRKLNLLMRYTNLRKRIDELTESIGSITEKINQFDLDELDVERKKSLFGKYELITFAYFLLVVSAFTIWQTYSKSYPASKVGNYCVKNKSWVNRLLFPICIDLRWAHSEIGPIVFSPNVYEVGLIGGHRLFMKADSQNHNNEHYDVGTLVINDKLILSKNTGKTKELFMEDQHMTWSNDNSPISNGSPKQNYVRNIVYIENQSDDNAIPNNSESFKSTISNLVDSLVGSAREMKCVRQGDPIVFHYPEHAHSISPDCQSYGDESKRNNCESYSKTNSEKLASLVSRLSDKTYSMSHEHLIIGFASPSGSAKKNFYLGERRANHLENTLRERMGENQISQLDISSYTRGESWPFTDTIRDTDGALITPKSPISLYVGCIKEDA